MQLTPIQKQPEYVQAVADINRMTAALQKVQERLAQVASEQSQKTSTLDHHVEGALRFAESGMSRLAFDRPAALEEERLLLLQQEEALRRSIQDRQTELNHLVTTLSVLASRSVIKQHKDIAARQAAVLRELDAAMKEEDALFAELRASGYTPSFSEYMSWPMVGRLSTPGSLLWQRVRDLDRYTGRFN